MRYGFCIPHHRPLATRDLIIESARRGESLGYDTIWLSDHIVPPNTAEERPRRIFYEPLALAGHLAAITSRVRIGTSVLVIPYRDPIVTAKQIATIDDMSGGRLLLGVGVGHLQAEFAALGVPFAARGRLTDEYLAVMRELWANDAPIFAGETVSFANVNFWPKPAQRPGPPIYVAGHTPPAIRRAAAIGDGWHPVNMPLSHLDEGIARFRAACAGAGRPADLPIAMRFNLSIRESGDGPRRPFAGAPEQIVEDMHVCAAAGVDELNFDFAVPPVETGEHWLAMLDRFEREIRPHAPK